MGIGGLACEAYRLLNAHKNRRHLSVIKLFRGITLPILNIRVRRLSAHWNFDNLFVQVLEPVLDTSDISTLNETPDENNEAQ